MVRVIACEAVAHELRDCVPPEVSIEVIDMALHERPAALRKVLQARIDALAGTCDTVVLGMGLCSRATVGLVSRDATLVLPRVDDCIHFFLGTHSGEATDEIPTGTYFLTRGWIDAGVTPFSEYDRFAARWGAKRADRLLSALLRHYTHLALVKTGDEATLGPYRLRAQETAERLHLEYLEVEGDAALMTRLLAGPWGQPDIITVDPCCPVTLSEYYDMRGEGH